MKAVLEKLIEGLDLSEQEMVDTFDTIMSGDATPAQIAAFLTALRIKGETIEEIAGAVTIMRKHSIKVDVGDLDTVDTCGTGGDASGNI